MDLDATDWRILAYLRRNARATFQEIGSAVAMTKARGSGTGASDGGGGAHRGLPRRRSNRTSWGGRYVMAHFKFTATGPTREGPTTCWSAS